MTVRPAIIVIGYSARALAASAARAGFAPLSIDVFGDDDMREMSFASVKLDGGLAEGLRVDKVVDAIETLISAHDPVALVYGAGFEHQPETVAAIARKIRVLGNAAETLRRVKDPVALARVCEANGVRHPKIAFTAPDEPRLWLMKRRGGAGGAHIVPANTASHAPDCYFQRRISGESVSALFLASERKAEIIGLSMQWTAPTPESPFRYGGAAGPIDIDKAQAAEIASAVAAVASELDLVGLNSADFLVSTDAVWLLEINPRPGATLDVFESNGAPLFARHVAACEGHRMAAASSSFAIKAAETVYAPHEVAMREGLNWPDWAVDRSPPGTRFSTGDPVCTVLAPGATVDLARTCASGRARKIIALVQEAKH